MEENISINIADHNIILKSSQFASMVPLVSMHQLQLLFHKDPLLSKINIPVINACLYFLILLTKNNTSPTITTNSIQIISAYYLQKQMNFDIYLYSHFCSKIFTHIPLNQCIHVIFFMIYGRYASQPYVNNLIQKRKTKSNAPKRMKTTRKYTSQEEKISQFNSKNDSRCNTVFLQNFEVQTENFAKELKNTLYSHCQSEGDKLLRSKRHINVKKSQHHSNILDLKKEDKQENKLSKKTNFRKKYLLIPKKVNQFENSLMLKTMKESVGSKMQIPHQKIQLRKQKYIENFDINQIYGAALSVQKVENFNQTQPFYKEINKISEENSPLKYHASPPIKNEAKFQHFQRILQEIKTSNSQLDDIRINYTKKQKSQNRNKRINNENEQCEQKCQQRQCEQKCQQRQCEQKCLQKNSNKVEKRSIGHIEEKQMVKTLERKSNMKRQESLVSINNIREGNQDEQTDTYDLDELLSNKHFLLKSYRNLRESEVHREFVQIPAMSHSTSKPSHEYSSAMTDIHGKMGGSKIGKATKICSIKKTADISTCRESRQVPYVELMKKNQPNIHTNITRKDSNSNLDDEPELLLFSKKVKNQLKLQQYKKEYRNFLKSNLIDLFTNIS